uniref:Peptidase A2 domain-containing protein n=1 Tax=Anopheles arabiensis TaxID=7173 RepID=A0A182HJH6_ANOAR
MNTIFSIIDLSDAYLQLEVDDDSKHLLTINTHRGLFRFNRLAPGVKSAPGAFQRLVDGMIADIPGLVKTEADDIISYAAKVNRACEDSEFHNMKADHFKCLVFICGLKGQTYADIRARLLCRIDAETADAPITLQNLVDDFQKLVNLKADTSIVEQQPNSSTTVNALHEKTEHHHHEQYRQRYQESKTSEQPRRPCWRCGQMHFVRDCQYSTHQCRKCNRVGHKEGYCGCFSKFKPAGEEKTNTKPSTSDQGKLNARGVYIVNHITQHSSKRKFVPATINGVTINLQLDTASDITVISQQTWQKLGSPNIQPVTIQAINASGKPLHLSGEFQCTININGQTQQGRCFVTTAVNLNLLGIEWIELFELWSIPIDTICNQLTTESIDQQMREIQAKHADVFKDTLGHCKKTKVKLYLKSNAKPVFCQKRPVPFNTIPLVDAELTRLQNLGIIETVDFSEWAAPIVA